MDKTWKKKFHARNVAILTKTEEKSFKFFSDFDCATQNKALDVMKLVTIFLSKNLWCKFQQNR